MFDIMQELEKKFKTYGRTRYDEDITPQQAAYLETIAEFKVWLPGALKKHEIEAQIEAQENIVSDINELRAKHLNSIDRLKAELEE